MDKAIQHLIDEEFSLATDIFYLNHAAISPWPKRTREAVCQFAKENSAYGASHYTKWQAQEQKLKKQLQRLINAHSADEIALLKNTSEALSVIAEGIDWQVGENIVSSDEEFPSNRIPWQAQEGVEFKEVKLGQTPEKNLMQACDNNTRLLTISAVQYGSGTRLNLKKLGAFCCQKDILFCVDAIQSLGVYPFDVKEINADFVVADGHKWMLGPEGLALFYCRQEILPILKLHQYGWHMIEQIGDYDNKHWCPAHSARRFECGSPNMLGVYALSASLSLLEQIGQQKISRIVNKKTSLIINLISNINDIYILSPTDTSYQSGIITFKIKGVDMPVLHRKLMKNKVICALRGGGIRFSPHFYTSDDIIYKSVEVLNINI